MQGELSRESLSTLPTLSALPQLVLTREIANTNEGSGDSSRDSAATRLCELIVCACPVGELAQQIEQYRVRARLACGENPADHDMPHITLTGFFHDQAASIPMYFAGLSAALSQARLQQPVPMLQIHALRLSEDFHGLLIESPWLKQMMANFSRLASSKTRTDAIRLKDGLHLSLAYQFKPQHHDTLAQLARELIDVSAPVHWQLRFYERSADRQWELHGLWKLD